MNHFPVLAVPDDQITLIARGANPEDGIGCIEGKYVIARSVQGHDVAVDGEDAIVISMAHCEARTRSLALQHKAPIRIVNQQEARFANGVTHCSESQGGALGIQLSGLAVFRVDSQIEAVKALAAGLDSCCIGVQAYRHHTGPRADLD